MQRYAEHITITKPDFEILIQLTQPCVYKAMRSDGQAVYIGSSGKGAARFLNALHERYQMIQEQADYIEVETFDTKREALAAERKAIEKMQPLYNGPKVCGPNYWLASKAIVIALLGMALCAGMASAQAQTYCPPVTVSYPDKATSDDGKGPGFGLSFNGHIYGSGTTVTVPPPQWGVYGVGAFGSQGWVNVRDAVFNGCPLSWLNGTLQWEMQTHSEVYDATTGKMVYGPTTVDTTSNEPCDADPAPTASSCHFDLWDNRWLNVAFVSGHTYYFYCYMDAFVDTIPAESNQYTGYIKIVIE